MLVERDDEEGGKDWSRWRPGGSGGFWLRAIREGRLVSRGAPEVWDEGAGTGCTC